MFDPINARLASSCSKKGIKEADMDAFDLVQQSYIGVSWELPTGKSPSLEQSLVSVIAPFLLI
jgi:hypothetical protein